MDPERLKNPCFTDEVDILTGKVKTEASIFSATHFEEFVVFFFPSFGVISEALFADRNR